MSPFARWCRFNLVGALGMGVQLATLAFLNRVTHGHYLVASTVAVEAAVLHNFAWHRRVTWRDRRDTSSWPTQLLRFHLANGLMSLLGNLLLMRLLVRYMHTPVLAANIIAIACCSLINFAISDRWAFRVDRSETANNCPTPNKYCHLDRSAQRVVERPRI